MNEGTEQPPFEVHRQVPCCPYCPGAYVARKDGVLGGKLVEYSGNVLRVDLLLMQILGRKIIKALPSLLMIFD
jgi:hypothetical protein